MNYEEVTLNYFFRNLEVIGNKNTSVESSEKIAKLRDTISKKEPLMEWSSVYKKVVEKSAELLNLKLKDILESGWRKYNLVEQYLEQGKTNPGVIFNVPLVNHTIVSEHHPKIEIRINEGFMGQINFEILLKLELSGIILSIKGGKIDEVKAGSCKCKGSVACEGIELFKDSSQTYDF